MRLENIKASPLPGGNAIKLSWENPKPGEYPYVRIIRREYTFPVKFNPVLPSEGIILSGAVYTETNESGNTIYCIEDNGLKAETVYYYSLYPYSGDPPVYTEDINNRAAATATGKYDTAEQMYDLLPRVYHRYDVVKNQLRNFLDLPGAELDLIHSMAAAILNLYNPNKVDGRLLPLLAQWIGWKTNYRREIDVQRNEIRNAPFIYQRVGFIPAIEATVKRFVDMESRTKEFVYNVFLSNNPEKFTLWTIERDNSTWSDNDELLSIDWAFEGRPVVSGKDKNIRLFYHTLRNNHWNIMSKKFCAFNIDFRFEAELNELKISFDLKNKFIENGFSLSDKAKLKKKEGYWLINDFQSYKIKKEGGALYVSTWNPSEPITKDKGLHKHPASVFYNNNFWVFWNSFDEKEQKWSIQCRTLIDEKWIEQNNIPDSNHECKRPWACANDGNKLWLFWFDKINDEWQFKYSMYDGAAWKTIQNFPVDSSGINSNIGTDYFILYNSADKSIWVLWSGQELVGSVKRMKLFYRQGKPRTDGSGIIDWEDFYAVEPSAKDYDDCEPSACINIDGNIELYFSSKRDGSWSIWNTVYNKVSKTWNTAQKITEGLYSQRNSLPVIIGNNTFLFYRSNESVTYPSNVYSATETVDFRYAGSTCFDTDNLLKKELQGQFEDFQAYTYDTGKTDEDWYSRDCIGIFMSPETDDKTLIDSNVDILKNLLPEFLPIQERPVFIIETPLYKEIVYTHDLPVDKFVDELNELIPEHKYELMGYSREDTIPDWTWIRTADCINGKYFDNHTVNFNTLPISTRFRTWHTAFIKEKVLWT